MKKFLFVLIALFLSSCVKEKIVEVPIVVRSVVFKVVVLDDVNFKLNSASLLYSGMKALDKLAQDLKASPELKVEIEGHTDDTGNENYNLGLSIKRAESVYNYLIAWGIKPDKMKFTGFGETQPKVENDSVENRSMNRRVEIKIIK